MARCRRAPARRWHSELLCPAETFRRLRGLRWVSWTGWNVSTRHWVCDASPRGFPDGIHEFSLVPRGFPSGIGGFGTESANFGSVPASSRREFTNSRQPLADSGRSPPVSQRNSRFPYGPSRISGRSSRILDRHPRIPLGIRLGPYGIRGDRKRAPGRVNPLRRRGNRPPGRAERKRPLLLTPSRVSAYSSTRSNHSSSGFSSSRR
jgi:hypothetical protein